MMSTVKTHTLVMLDVRGNSENDIIISKRDGIVTRIPKNHVYLIDPDEHAFCVPAAAADKTFIYRCEQAAVTFAWVMTYMIEAVPLVAFKQPASPPSLTS